MDGESKVLKVLKVLMVLMVLMVLTVLMVRVPWVHARTSAPRTSAP
ncbi:MAG: hypothetical protein ACRD1S_02160 [Vicinamibacterales bacterium]